MIATAHQPHFLPWLGYINKAANSDAFIWLDSVQFRKNYFQNRTRIMGTDRQERWLTLPVHANHDSIISQVLIADGGWRVRIQRTIEQSYGRAPHFTECWPALLEAMGRAAADDRLSELNYRLFMTILQLLGLTVRVVRGSDLDVPATNPTERLVALCAALGADTYIAGKSGQKYLDVSLFSDANIVVTWQQFDVTRTAYRRADGVTVSGLSVIDCLFHVGPERTRELALSAWAVPR